MGNEYLTPSGYEVPEINLTTDDHGPSQRVRVDVGQTGFFSGHEFRTFKELSIAGSGTYLIRAIVPVNLILFGLQVAINSGDLKLETFVGGTPTGTFSETLPILPANNMTDKPLPLYAAQSVLQAVPSSGSLAGGVRIDVVRVKTNAITNQAATVGVGPTDERGVNPGTYYFLLTNLSSVDAIEGVFRARWEERP